MIHNTSWPYANETGITEKLSCDRSCSWRRTGAISLNHPLRNRARVCADYFTIKNHPLPIIKSVTGNFFISLLIHF